MSKNCGTGVWKMDSETIQKHFDLENKIEKCYKANDLIIKCVQKNIIQDKKVVCTEYLIQLIENYGSLNANILMQKKTTDKKVANNNFKYIISLVK